ncbi:acyltransferase [Cellvibrio zantedeschiae]|uniref:Acyltransferase n=1 Tax=Cellvibrio zantedeschiae TaxID=1237077 RepID=A0ABQ3AUM0_9GAMM|nr:acyltransferase [Cellvibrio zantedeschiae]
MLFVVFTLIVFIPLMPLALLKWLVPFTGWQALCNRWLDWLASHWMDANARHQQIILPTQLEVEGMSNLSVAEWYMMIANHQSWVDILVLLRFFNRRIPYLKFFLKQSLIWVPLLGLAWWALEFPFMRRYTKAEIARNPELKGKDIEKTRQACEKFRHNPVTIINFLEGTRFTPAKYTQQKSIYRHLLMPKAGGLAFTLAAMNGQLHSLLDVTIYYPEGRPSYWDYACGRVRRICVDVRERPIPEDMLGNYGDDNEFRERFQGWVNQIWQEKDALLDKMNSSH